MRKKLLIFSLMAVASITILAAAAGLTAFVLADSNPIQIEEAVIDQPIQVAPVEIEPVTVIKPILRSEDVGYAAHEGDCPFSEAKMQLTKAPAEQVVDDNLLSLAD